MNFFKAAVGDEGDVVTFAGGVVAPAPFAKGAARPGASLTIGIRPEHFERGSAADASIEATVDFVENLGGTSFVHGHVSTGEKIIAERRDVAGVKAQQSLRLGFTMGDARAFDADGARIR
jgi:lactose/L-arabinose transport system ATP-binding protein